MNNDDFDGFFNINANFFLKKTNTEPKKSEKLSEAESKK